MDAKYYAYNQTRGCFLSGELTLLDAGLEPLRVLKVLIEGLAPEAKSGLWLTHFRSVPVARTLSPFDLVYLDSEFRVVHAIELSTDGEFSPFKGQPASALVLPYQSIASSHTRAGDQLIVRMADTPGRPIPSSSHATVPGQQSAVATESPSALQATAAAHHAPVDDRTASPLEHFLAQQSAIAGRGRVKQNTKSLLDLSPAERAPAPTVQSPLAQSSPAVAEPLVTPRPAIHAVPSPNPLTREARSGPTRAPRIAPPPIATPPSDGAPPSSIPATGPSDPSSGKPGSTWKVAPFPLRSNAAPRSVEPQFRPSDVEEYRPQPPEKTSLLMRILRLQFIKRDQAAPEAFGVARVGQLDEATPARTVPQLAVRFLRWLYPELEISTAADVAVQPSYSATTKFQHDVKPSLDVKFFKWIYPDLSFRRPQLEVSTDRRLSARLSKPGLVAYYFTGGPPRAHKIGDISVTGFYMHTDERWMPGTIIRMTLQMVGTSGEGPTDTLTVHSRVVRWGPDGEGFEFVLAGFLDEPLPISYGRSDRMRRRLE